MRDVIYKCPQGEIGYIGLLIRLFLRTFLMLDMPDFFPCPLPVLGSSLPLFELSFCLYVPVFTLLFNKTTIWLMVMAVR